MIIFLLQKKKFIGKSICGEQKKVYRLIGTFKINNGYAREVLNWSPAVSILEGIR